MVDAGPVKLQRGMLVNSQASYLAQLLQVDLRHPKLQKQHPTPGEFDVNKSEIANDASQLIWLMTRLIAYAKLAAVAWKWGRAWIARSTSELMTIEEAAAYAGVSSATVQRVAKLHPEMVVRDGNGRNPRYIRREVHRLLKMAPKLARPNR